jgi:hypothetical protein
MARWVAIVGSRDYPDLDAVHKFVDTLDIDDIVISGGARGVDRTAEEAADVRGLESYVYEAEWDKYGKRAGFLRNIKIVEECSELVAFWDGISKGTAHSIYLARKAGKPVTVFTPDK